MKFPNLDLQGFVQPSTEFGLPAVTCPTMFFPSGVGGVVSCVIGGYMLCQASSEWRFLNRPVTPFLFLLLAECKSEPLLDYVFLFWSSDPYTSLPALSQKSQVLRCMRLGHHTVAPDPASPVYGVSRFKFLGSRPTLSFIRTVNMSQLHPTVWQPQTPPMCLELGSFGRTG